jgi:diacylglycerol kinase family enzyme
MPVLFFKKLKSSPLLQENARIFFVINPGSGTDKTDWRGEADSFFTQTKYQTAFYELTEGCQPEAIKKEMLDFSPSVVVSCGGDGTVKLVAALVKDTNIPMAILPAGSANGMAKELKIPPDPKDALKIIVEGTPQKIHLLEVNGETCIHLSDAGFNAFIVKKFEEGSRRGQWGYVKAAWKALWNHTKMEVTIVADGERIRRRAVMVVLANATMYGNGVVINPAGSLQDDLFEVVIMKKISLAEIFKMRFTQGDFNTKKTELMQTSEVRIASRHRFHFQTDGEYRGKIKTVEAKLLPGKITVLVPAAMQER